MADQTNKTKNTDKGNTTKSGFKQTLLNGAEKVWETVDPEGYAEAKNNPQKLLEKMIPGYEAKVKNNSKEPSQEPKQGNTTKSGFKQTLLNGAEKVWETVDPEGYAEAKNNPQKLLEKMIPGYKATEPLKKSRKTVER